MKRSVGNTKLMESANTTKEKLRNKSVTIHIDSRVQPSSKIWFSFSMQKPYQLKEIYIYIYRHTLHIVEHTIRK